MRTTIIAGLILALAAARLEAQAAPVSPAWDITLGGGAIVVPSYAGSKERQVFPFPLAKVVYRDRAYVGPSASGMGLGAELEDSRSGLFVLRKNSATPAGFPRRPGVAKKRPLA